MSQFEQWDNSSSSVGPTNTSVDPANTSVGIKRKRLWSKVWDDFEREEIDNDKTVAKCKTCKSVFTATSLSGTSQVLADVLLESLYAWNIERKISAITVDNASTNDAMMAIMLQTLTRSSLLLDGNYIHVRCGAHVLNLIVKEGLSVIESKIERIRKSCVFWTLTQSRREKFEAAALQLHIPVTKGLETDVKTRWNSSYYMLRSALVYKDVFAKAKQRDKSYDSLPSDEDWVIAKDICERLKIFDDVTVLFSGTLYPTANSFFRKICEIKLELRKWLESPNEVVKAMAIVMVEKYDKYWSNCHVILGVACVLDPRYKMKLVEYYFSKIYGAESGIEIEKIKQACYDLFLEYQTRFDVTHSEGRSSSGTVNLVEDDDLTNFDLYVNESSMDSESELELYLKEKLIHRREELDLLQWWNAQKGFPVLQKIARDLLAVQVSTVASESTFSASGRLITPHRSRLHVTTLRVLMCAQSWLWSDLKDSDSNGGVELQKVDDKEEEPMDEMEGGSAGSI